MGSSPDYYAVLGIRRGEGAVGIRRAFRRLVVRYHPDRASEEQSRRFQQVVEAYRVLSDASQRQAYDEAHSAAVIEPMSVPMGSVIVDVTSRAPRPPPLSLFHDFCAPESEIREVSDRWTRNFTEIGVPKSERLRPLDLDIILSADEAEQGTAVAIAVPALRHCPTCDGSGRDWLFPCLECAGQGIIEEERLLELQIPQAIQSDRVFEVPLSHLGVHNLYLRVRLRVD